MSCCGSCGGEDSELTLEQDNEQDEVTEETEAKAQSQE